MSKPFRTLDDADVSGKRVLLRVDLNVPTENGRVTDTTRIERVASTIEEIATKGGKVILLAHFGRPKGGPDEANSLRPVAAAVADIVKRPVAFATDCIGKVAADAIAKMKNGDILLLENTRFYKGEEKNDPALVDGARQARRHLCQRRLLRRASRPRLDRGRRAQAAGLLRAGDAGRARGADHRARALRSARSPRSSAAPRSRPSSSCSATSSTRSTSSSSAAAWPTPSCSPKARRVGKSLCEKDMADTARAILAEAGKAKCRIVLPVDATVAKELKPHVHARVVDVDHVADDEMILDIGPKSVVAIEEILGEIKTLVWNGPFGAFETPPFEAATFAIAKTVGSLTRDGKLKAIAGGGDTVAALNEAGVAGQFTYVSAAGGAFLEWMEGKALPGVEALRAK